MPGIKRELKSWNEDNGKDKLGDFVDKYWHYDNITKMSESKFIDHYCRWAEKKDTIKTRRKKYPGASKVYTKVRSGGRPS